MWKKHMILRETEELAEEFLEFVKKRAGFSFELGDDRYSFVI